MVRNGNCCFQNLTEDELVNYRTGSLLMQQMLNFIWCFIKLAANNFAVKFSPVIRYFVLSFILTLIWCLSSLCGNEQKGCYCWISEPGLILHKPTRPTCCGFFSSTVWSQGFSEGFSFSEYSCCAFLSWWKCVWLPTLLVKMCWYSTCKQRDCSAKSELMLNLSIISKNRRFPRFMWRSFFFFFVYS